MVLSANILDADRCVLKPCQDLQAVNAKKQVKVLGWLRFLSAIICQKRDEYAGHIPRGYSLKRQYDTGKRNATPCGFSMVR